MWENGRRGEAADAMRWHAGEAADGGNGNDGSSEGQPCLSVSVRYTLSVSLFTSFSESLSVLNSVASCSGVAAMIRIQTSLPR